MKKHIVALALAMTMGIVTVMGGVPFTVQAEGENTENGTAGSGNATATGSGTTEETAESGSAATTGEDGKIWFENSQDKISITKDDGDIIELNWDAELSQADENNDTTVTIEPKVTSDNADITVSEIEGDKSATILKGDTTTPAFQTIKFKIEAKQKGIKGNITVSATGKIGEKAVTIKDIVIPVTVKEDRDNYIVRATFSGSKTVTVGSTVDIVATVTFTKKDGTAFSVKDGDFYIDIYGEDDGEEYLFNIQKGKIKYEGNVVTIPFTLKGLRAGKDEIYVGFSSDEIEWLYNDENDDFAITVVNASTSPTSSTRTTTATTTRSSSSSSSSDDDDDDSKSFSDGGTKTKGSGSSKADYKKSSSTSVKYVASAVSYSAKTATVPATVKVGGKTYNVTSISSEAFYGYDNIQTLTIGKNIKKIGKSAFEGCTKLKTLTVNSRKLTAKNIKGAFKGASIKTVYVPADKVDAYKKILTKKVTGNKTKISVKAKKTTKKK